MYFSFQCAFLYPQPSEEHETDRPSATSPDGQYEGFYLVEKTVRRKLDEMLKKELSSNSPPGSCESLVSGGLCMALTYIQRCEREQTKTKGVSEMVNFYFTQQIALFDQSRIIMKLGNM